MEIQDHVDGTLPADTYAMLTGLEPPDVAEGEEVAKKLPDGRKVIFAHPRGSEAVYVIQYTSILKLGG